MGEFTMPSLGADMEAGTIIEWRVRPGDVVHRGDIVAVVDTEKSDIEVEVFEDGVVEELLVDVGRSVEVGTPLARIGVAGVQAGGTAPQAAAGVAIVDEPVAPVDEPPAPRSRRRAPRPTGVVRASPLARRRAVEEGLDLGSLAGSGPGGAVLAADVAPDRAAPPSRERGDRQTARRRATAELMARSKREIPHFYVATTVDLAAATAWLADENGHRPVAERLLPAALLLKATALAARAVPTVNGSWDGGFRAAPEVHLGVVVSLRGGGLVAPAIRAADRLSLDELMAALRGLVERARAGRLRSSEVSDPTLTVTNLGDQGAEEVYGVIYPPQVALVGFGRIVDRPWAVGGMLGVRPTVRATLAADHRATDGHEGSRFLAVLDRLLNAPEDL